MKKLLALLLTVCLLLPSAAFADAVSTRMEMQIAKEACRALVTNMLAPNGTEIAPEVVDTVIDFVCGVLDVAAVEYTVQENGVEFTVFLKDQPLLSAGITIDQTEMVLSTSLLKDSVFVLQLPETAKEAVGFNWEELLGDMAETAQEWYVSRDITYEPIGNFAGNAYDDGDERILIRIDDLDIALLVEGLLLEAERSGLLSFVNDMLGTEPVSELIGEIRAVNYKAALENIFDYELSIVYRQKDLGNEFAGASLNVLYKNKLAWSLSVGQKDGQVKFIGIFHVDGKTNYFVLTEKVDKHSSKASDTTHAFAVYQVEDGISYAEASANPENALMYCKSVMSSVITGTSAHYRRVIGGQGEYAVGSDKKPFMRFEATEEYAESPFTYRLDAKAYLDEYEDAAVTYRISKKSAESFAHPDGAEKIDMDMLTNDKVLREEVVTRIFDEGIAEMSVIAFKNIPAELLMQLMQLMQ